MEQALEDLLRLADQLSDPFREVREGIRRALGIAEADPEMALIRSRKVLDLLVRDVYERRVADSAGTRPLDNLLQRLVKDGHWPARLEAYASAVRILGNVGAHRSEAGVTAADVSSSLAQLLPILKWYCASERPDALAAPAGTGTGLKGLRAAARVTDRIWPLPVEECLQDGQGTLYSVSGLAASQETSSRRLRLGSRVFWAVQLEEEAHLLLLDEDPEGKTYCLSPSWFVPDTRLPAGVTLLPPPSANCEPFVVTGVPGREHLLAILSQGPLGLDWMPADPTTPARVLTAADVDRLLAVLRRLPPGSWTALTASCEIVV